MNDKITCIITTYKRDKSLLRRSLESVVNQTYSNIEILIIDDNDKNEYHDIVNSLVKEFDNEKIKHIFNGYNRGVQVARNHGIESSTGEYIAFLDDDDFWYEDKLLEQHKLFTQNRELGLVYCNYDVIEERKDGNIVKHIEVPNYSDKEKLTQLLRKNFIASTSLPLINKKVFDKVGNFDVSLVASQDYDMWLRITKHFDIDYVNKSLAAYIRHEGERISTNNERKALAEKMFLVKHKKLYIKDRIAVSNKLMMIGLYLLRNSEFDKARKYFIKSIKANPKNLRLYKYFLETYVRSL